MLGAQIPAHVLHKLNPAGGSVFNSDELKAILFPKHRDLVNSPTGYFLNFLNNPHLSTKIEIFWRRLFLSREDLAFAYSIATHSPWLYLYYPVRVKDLLGRYMHKTWRMWRGDPDMVAVVGHQDKLQRWLEQA